MTAAITHLRLAGSRPARRATGSRCVHCRQLAVLRSAMAAAGVAAAAVARAGTPPVSVGHVKAVLKGVAVSPKNVIPAAWRLVRASSTSCAGARS